MNKVLSFTLDENRYRKLAEERAEKGDFASALAFLFSAKSIAATPEVIMDIADVYADMGLLELSNKYWFKYIDKAPKERVSVAYEELAINYFYLDNYWASSYYFHKKLDLDGRISKEGLDKEIIDFFSGEEFKNNAYRLAYPFDRADYSYNVKLAKHFLALGAFGEAKKPLLEIPECVRSEDGYAELAMAMYMSDDLDGAEKACRDSINKHGEHVAAYCHLSTVYNMRKDEENAEYYYQKALSVRKGAKGEEYNLATCAIERADHLTAKDCIIKILEERPYEVPMRFFYGIALINLHDYQGAEREFSTAFRINPEDRVVEYYMSFAKRLNSGDFSDEKLIPLKYEKELPKKAQKKYAQKLKALIDNPEKIEFELKKSEIRKIVEWGLYNGEGQTPRDAAYILSMGGGKYAKNLFKTALLDPEIKEEIKRVLIYVYIINGYKEKIGITAGSFYTAVKPKKLTFERQDDGAIYCSAYALCVARIAFWETENLDVVGKVAEKAYKMLKGVVTESDVTNEELAALLLSECGYNWVKSDNEVTKLFEITPQKLSKLKEFIKGE